MKLGTKCIADKLKRIILHFISETQNAFVSCRLMIDNALIAFECFHHMKLKKKGKKGYMALKLDMSKACDRMKFRFLHAVLHTMEFPTSFTNLIMCCVTSVS